MRILSSSSLTPKWWMSSLSSMTVALPTTTTTLSTARETLQHVAERIAIGHAPEEHAFATALTLWQIGDVAGDLPLTLADLAAGLARLVSPRAFAESPTTTALRKTCDEVAALLRPTSAGDPRRVAAVLRVVAAHCAQSRDSHHVAIAATAAREAAELEAA